MILVPSSTQTGTTERGTLGDRIHGIGTEFNADGEHTKHGALDDRIHGIGTEINADGEHT